MTTLRPKPDEVLYFGECGDGPDGLLWVEKCRFVWHSGLSRKRPRKAVANG